MPSIWARKSIRRLAPAQKITSVQAVKGIITTNKLRPRRRSIASSIASQTDRTLLIEHPNRTNQQFKLVDTDKPVEDTPDVYRFQTPVKAGETKTFTVKEEKEIANAITLTNNADDSHSLLHQSGRSQPGSEATSFRRHSRSRVTWDVARRELDECGGRPATA